MSKYLKNILPAANWQTIAASALTIVIWSNIIVEHHLELTTIDLTKS
jgi:hypothetical protein